RGHSNGRYHDWRSWNHPTRRSERRRTLSSEELGDEIRLLPGRPRTPKSSPSSIRSLRFRLDWWLWGCRGCYGCNWASRAASPPSPPESTCDSSPFTAWLRGAILSPHVSWEAAESDLAHRWGAPRAWLFL